MRGRESTTINVLLAWWACLTVCLLCLCFVSGDDLSLTYLLIGGYKWMCVCVLPCTLTSVFACLCCVVLCVYVCKRVCYDVVVCGSSQVWWLSDGVWRSCQIQHLQELSDRSRWTQHALCVCNRVVCWTVSRPSFYFKMLVVEYLTIFLLLYTVLVFYLSDRYNYQLLLIY